MAREHAQLNEHDGDTLGLITDVVQTSPVCNMVPKFVDVMVQAPVTPAVEKEAMSPGNSDSANKQMVVSYAAVVAGTAWPADLVVTEMVADLSPGLSEQSAYLVHSTPSEEQVIESVAEIHEAVKGNGRNPEGKMDHVLHQVEVVSKKRNLESEFSPSSSSNSFAILSNLEIMSRASLMGIDMPSDNFDNIDLLRELEKSRDNISSKNAHLDDTPLVVVDNNGERTPMCLTWLNEADVDTTFSVVKSRKNKRNCNKNHVTVARPATRSQTKTGTSTQPPGRPVRQRSVPDRFK